jgi:hypothetical protein
MQKKGLYHVPANYSKESIRVVRCGPPTELPTGPTKMFRTPARTLFLLTLALAACVHKGHSAFVQKEVIPYVPLQFFNAAGTAPATLGYVCTFAARSSTPLFTYSDSGLTTANENPIRLNAAGRPTHSNAEVPVFLRPASYKFVVYAAGSGKTCNGTPVGAVIKTIDNIDNLAQLQRQIFATKLDGKICHASRQRGTTPNDMSGKIAACVAALPATGGTVDARGLVGAQTISTDPFAGSSKPITLLLGAATISASTRIIVPPNSSIIGVGKKTKIQSRIPNGTSELIRLNGDYSAALDMWLNGTGQGSYGNVNGSRGIWIGCPSDYITECRVNYARVESMTITQFVGNGISGDYWYATIVNNDISYNQDSNIFCQPTCQWNLFQGNTTNHSWYSGFDIVGSYNRFIGNTSNANGITGGQDPYSKAGFLVAYSGSNAHQPGAVNNQLIGNHADGGGLQIWGIFVYNPEPTTAEATGSVTGTVLSHNVTTNHTIQYNQSAGFELQSWGGGIVVMGARNVTVTSNRSTGNTFNYIVVGDSNGTSSTSPGVVMTHNVSEAAVSNAALSAGVPPGSCRIASAPLPSGVGYFFPSSARLDLCGGYTAQGVLFSDNIDRSSATDGFMWHRGNAVAVPWIGWRIERNHSEAAGRYGFNLQDPASFFDNHFGVGNYATNAATAPYNGLSRYTGVGLDSKTATPSVAHGLLWFTANDAPRIYTSFLGGSPNQEISIRVADTKTTFAFGRGNLRGNASTSYTASPGDLLSCLFDGTNWTCEIAKPPLVH